jgi:hypothetical protein
MTEGRFCALNNAWRAALDSFQSESGVTLAKA